MDLIYMNAAKEDVGVMKDFTFDMAIGADENDFQCQIVRGNHCCEEGFFLYVEGTEYGGIIDRIGANTDADVVTYRGRTWHGILEAQVIEPETETDVANADVIVGGKNRLNNNKTSRTVNGVTFTVNTDKSVTANGTASSMATFAIDANFDKPGKYIMTGCPEGGSAATYYMVAGGVGYDYGNGLNVTVEDASRYIAVTVMPGCTVDNLTFYPMMRPVFDGVGNYQPYKSYVNEYLMLSGEANHVLQWLIDRLDLSDLFCASTEDSGINISYYKMNRYICGYTGIRKMLRASGAKLMMAFKNGKVELSAVPLVDYSTDEQFDTDQMAFSVVKNYRPLNHVICLGKGELAEREVIHVYADSNCNISHTQSLTGIDEVATTYDNANAESSEELEQGGIDLILASQNSDEIKFDFDSNDESYDIGDIVGAKEKVTGIEVRVEITKKIVTINNNSTTISYKVGE